MTDINNQNKGINEKQVQKFNKKSQLPITSVDIQNLQENNLSPQNLKDKKKENNSNDNQNFTSQILKYKNQMSQTGKQKYDSLIKSSKNVQNNKKLREIRKNSIIMQNRKNRYFSPQRNDHQLQFNQKKQDNDDIEPILKELLEFNKKLIKKQNKKMQQQFQTPEKIINHQKQQKDITEKKINFSVNGQTLSQKSIEDNSIISKIQNSQIRNSIIENASNIRQKNIIYPYSQKNTVNSNFYMEKNEFLGNKYKQNKDIFNQTHANFQKKQKIYYQKKPQTVQSGKRKINYFNSQIENQDINGALNIEIKNSPNLSVQKKRKSIVLHSFYSNKDLGDDKKLEISEKINQNYQKSLNQQQQLEQLEFNQADSKIQFTQQPFLQQNQQIQNQSFTIQNNTTKCQHFQKNLFKEFNEKQQETSNDKLKHDNEQNKNNQVILNTKNNCNSEEKIQFNQNYTITNTIQEVNLNKIKKHVQNYYKSKESDSNSNIIMTSQETNNNNISKKWNENSLNIDIQINKLQQQNQFRAFSATQSPLQKTKLLQNNLNIVQKQKLLKESESLNQMSKNLFQKLKKIQKNTVQCDSKQIKNQQIQQLRKYRRFPNYSLHNPSYNQQNYDGTIVKIANFQSGYKLEEKKQKKKKDISENKINLDNLLQEQDQKSYFDQSNISLIPLNLFDNSILQNTNKKIIQKNQKDNLISSNIRPDEFKLNIQDLSVSNHNQNISSNLELMSINQTQKILEISQVSGSSYIKPLYEPNQNNNSLQKFNHKTKQKKYNYESQQYKYNSRRFSQYKDKNQRLSKIIQNVQNNNDKSKQQILNSTINISKDQIQVEQYKQQISTIKDNNKKDMKNQQKQKLSISQNSSVISTFENHKYNNFKNKTLSTQENLDSKQNFNQKTYNTKNQIINNNKNEIDNYKLNPDQELINDSIYNYSLDNSIGKLNFHKNFNQCDDSYFQKSRPQSSSRFTRHNKLTKEKIENNLKNYIQMLENKKIKGTPGNYIEQRYLQGGEFVLNLGQEQI
ncbi:hypothetical protein PPERSA_01250 [Pseudocohnilembus persalinus]|uniref:Uncharacterized protein n=1 Tax=Pseudocohnilembus persalinus TaxID=266149 RepID=A0A0V0QGE3_PSEPJ|nr:hypothetical protein PPERSA_01250 [Pseudocohnilembus persalinus]|eukprot:KRX01347.1 hypothetical protein PPERSA_01250 [Pseudocohnilembus persalinus]